jgi:DNA-binding NtrC family response regulator
METFEILVVDDEPEMLVSYEKILTRAGYAVRTALSGKTALDILDETQDFVLMICDLKMPKMDGLELVSIVKKEHPYLPIIMVTGHGSLEQGIEAVKNGVFDFIEKPFSSKKLLSSIENALKQISPSREENNQKTGFGNIIGNSPAMQRVYDLVKKVAYGNANVLITGESGVGKELIARSIHKHSVRRNQPLIPINCGALPGALFESELFGYEKGSFTGAFQSKPGLVELANGGTLFLDEICEMPLDLQVKLLRMFEDRKIRRIGGQSEIPVDVRVLSATNRVVEESVANGQLREDLFFRINTIHIHVPPLRERPGDISLLIRHFLHELDRKYNRRVTDLEPAAKDCLQNYDWPGNIRELQNIIESAYYLATPPYIRIADLPAKMIRPNGSRNHQPWKELPYKEAKELMLEEFERDYLKFHLEKHNWNISQTAEICGLDRRTIHRLVNKFDLKK